MRTTIKDIANYTGFSVTTISLVLNGKAPKIPDTTKAIILKAAKDLSYRPNQLAVGLVKRRTMTLGLIISDIRNVFFSHLAKGVEDECCRNGWNLILCNTNDLHTRELEYIDVLADKGVDGILYGMSLDSTPKMAGNSINHMTELKIPFVMVDRFIEAKDSSVVAVDHKMGGYLATKHLIDLGHKRIGCITGPKNLSDSQDRLLGYQKALAEDGIEFDTSIIYEGHYDKESGISGLDYLLDKEVTAIFAFNDMSAFGVYYQMKQHHLKMPSDISVVGYDDTFICEMLDVPLTTIRQPIYDMGVAAVTQLITQIEKKSSTQNHIILQPELIIRESSKSVFPTK